MTEFTIKDSGARQEFGGGMVRDTEAGKIDFTSCVHGPMLDRWNDHMTKGRTKYPDPELGVPNWTRGAGDPSVMERAKRSAFRHFLSWLRGEEDEDHAAGVFFNINVSEYVKESLAILDVETVDEEIERLHATPLIPLLKSPNSVSGDGNPLGCWPHKTADGGGPFLATNANNEEPMSAEVIQLYEAANIFAPCGSPECCDPPCDAAS